MNDLVDQFKSINTPILIACDGNRRKEVNMVKRSKGFNWGAGGVSCAYWKGVLLRDVLLASDIEGLVSQYANTRLWVNFQGADELSEGRYETSIPLDHVMDANNDILLAYAMNDSPLPADHGYPLRLVIPGFVGGRNVKWLRSIWVTDRENESHYHVYGNRVVPSFVKERESEIGKTMYHHPSMACMEQMLNSVLVAPAQGERIDVAKMTKGETYRVKGYAYNGGGNEIQRVEVSLDGGESWFYCIRQFPDAPLRHGKKFWTWLHWHVDIEMPHLLRAESITVRCWDVNKNTQPEKIRWNLEGMMNNAQYIVKSELSEDPETKQTCILFRHPCEPSGDEGWMKPSLEGQIEDLERQGSIPGEEYSREEIKKHQTEDDCWLVINGKVYDATKVLDWHPGGTAAIMAHAGRVHTETTEEFESIHDDYAAEKLQECILGTASQSTLSYMQTAASEQAKSKAKAASQDDTQIALQRHEWTQARLKHKIPLSNDTTRYTFSLPSTDQKLGLEAGQHVQVGFHFKYKMVVRSYTPVKPILSTDEDGTFNLVVKTYREDLSQPGGTMSNILDCLRDKEEIEIKGPTEEIKYQGNGLFVIDDREHRVDRITLVLGGSGITPGYQVIGRVLSTPGDKTQIRVIDANRSQNDILMRTELDQFAKEHADQIEVTHVLSHPAEGWTGLTGHVDKDILHENAFAPDEKTIALLCGPPALITQTVLPVLEEWGYDAEKNVFGF